MFKGYATKENNMNTSKKIEECLKYRLDRSFAKGVGSVMNLGGSRITAQPSGFSFDVSALAGDWGYVCKLS